MRIINTACRIRQKVYIGAKYTFAELLDQDEVAFKFRLIVERYILAEKEVDPQDTLETHLYYLKPDSFLVKIYDRIKAREDQYHRGEKGFSAEAKSVMSRRN